MNGYGSGALAEIDVELKEAVCDSLVNAIVGKISGTDDDGRVVYGRSPRRSIVSGQLLPRFDTQGQDDTSDIRIAALGIDFLVSGATAETLAALPKFSVYVRILPTWSDIDPNGGALDVDFRLNAGIAHQIEQNIRDRRTATFREQNIERPDWRNMDEAARSAMRERRAKLQEEIRVAAYAEQGIRLNPGELLQGRDQTETQAQPAEDQNSPDETAAEAPAIGGLIREGREIPFHLVEPAPIPQKWKRIDLDLPALEWAANLVDDELDAHVAGYCTQLGASISRQLAEWLAGDGIAEAWRNLSLVPDNVAGEANWNAFIARARETAPDRARLLPDLANVVVKAERQTDFLDPNLVSFRVTLDNQCQELSGRDAQSLCNAIFGTGLTVIVPAALHTSLSLDRVEPSYRFRHYLEYPAIGLNNGVMSHHIDDRIALVSTWSPRFVQPRIVPTNIGLQCDFAELANPSFPLADLLTLPSQYRDWIESSALKLRQSVRDGLTPADADLESERLQRDLDGQRSEAKYIERGIRLLVEAQQAAIERDNTSDPQRREALHRRSIPWLAWTMMNELFARREKYQKGRGWRLFQLAFILAHIPTLASRLETYRENFDELLDEESASLLYFPTGGGKSEAFYGTLLFALFLDRLRGKDRGVTALIRYPLRLLTLQQAQRLLKLVVQAELVRRTHQAGSWPFEMGFWVGSANTPNTYAGIRSDVPKLGNANHPDDLSLEEGARGTEDDQDRARKYREIRDSYNKVPDCPVCGSATGLRRNETEGATAKRAAIVCFNARCDWNTAHGDIHPLPFLLTDDTIYERAPAIILGTVDKLAMLGQNTSTVSKVLGMFGLARWIDQHGHLQTERRQDRLQAGPEADGYVPVFPAYRRGRPVFFDPFPSLIIQDEAHLLEESLGTFSGLFDTLLENVFREIGRFAGDDLHVAKRWTGDNWGSARMPKFVAATATISNPERQLETLYQRQPLRFPYPGPDIYHSFFAEPASPPAINSERVHQAETLPEHLVPEATSPWMRLYVSIMMNGATHTVTTVQVLSSFHAIITGLWVGLLDPQTRDVTVERLRRSVSAGQAGAWHRAAIDRAISADKISDILALVDLHRVTLAYVTNKKGGDQIMDALDAAVRQLHRENGYELDRFDSRLISGGVDMKEIQRVMADAGLPFEGKPYPQIDATVRNIVATSAISHGVDVDRFNSMFFAGLPSDIAEYIQASSRVGRTHVGFVMLLPTPQNRRDRYVVETHDIFHRFLERMIAPPAVERWAENAIRRTLASFVQTWTMIREAEEFFRLPDDGKGRMVPADMVRRLGSRARDNRVGFNNDLGDFVLRSAGYAGRGASKLGAPHYKEHYQRLVDYEVQRFADAMTRQQMTATLRDYWDGQTTVFQKPMTSLRDVDEAGYIVASDYDPHATGNTHRIDLQELAAVMRAIRSQRGDAAEMDADGGRE